MTFFWLYAAWGFSTLIADSRWTMHGHSWRKICWPFSACLRLGVWTALPSDCLLLCFHVLELLKGHGEQGWGKPQGLLAAEHQGCLSDFAAFFAGSRLDPGRPEDQQIHRTLRGFLNSLKSHGKKSSIRNNCLIVDDRKFTVEDLTAQPDLLQSLIGEVRKAKILYYIWPTAHQENHESRQTELNSTDA
ncbi:hypothetical protein JTB14_030767 [Gonioctena quinquepunctata]|nr:hypothetical protein JTB14_030767 [Gonioctena quinquepunctata]